MSLFLLLFIPVIAAGVMYAIFRTTITWKEFLVQLIATSALIAGFWMLAKWGSMQDTEHWNGRIIRKDYGTQSCCHCTTVCDTCTDSKGNSYSCNCRQVCNHAIDYWWSIDINTGDTIRDGCNGWSHVPKWWEGAREGEPASVEHSYQNYLKADPESLFSGGSYEKYMNKIPDIPGIYDEYKTNKVIGDIQAPPFWESGLREINADLGNSKQIDILVYITKEKDPEFADALAAKWLYGPKNALILVLGAPDGNTISWARVVTISRVEELKIELRDYFTGKVLDDKTHLIFLRDIISKKFHRTPMAEFEYLASAAQPKGWVLVLLFIFALALSIGAGIYMHKNDVFGDEKFSFRKW